MEIEFIPQSLCDLETDAIIIGLYERNSSPMRISPSSDKKVSDFFSAMNNMTEFKGRKGEVSIIYTNKFLPTPRVVLVGLGKSNQVTLQDVRSSSAVGIKKARDLGCESIGISLLGGENASLSKSDIARTIIEGAYLGLYRWRKNHTALGEGGDIKKMYFVTLDEGKHDNVSKGILEGQAISFGVILTRDLVNQAPNKLTPIELAKYAEVMAKEVGISCLIHEEEWIKSQNMNAFLAVAQGSGNPPRFIELEYMGSEGAPIVLIGKGITFDSGGISIKPSEGMQDMRTDMGGAAAVIGAISAVAKMKLPIHLVSLIAACENLPGGSAYRPADVITSRKGKTIEVISTDAEGRMTLADALDYACTFSPRVVVDLATLTGACVIALGENVAAGYFTNNEDLAQKIDAASRATGEKLWRLPSYDEYNEKIKSDYADIKNSGGKGSGVGSSAKFLERFVDYPWAHWDIAGMVLDKLGPVSIYPLTHPPYNIRGATGFGVRALVALIKEFIGN